MIHNNSIMTVIGMQPLDDGRTVVALSLYAEGSTPNKFSLQIYHPGFNGRTAMDHDEGWGTEKGLMAAFDRLVSDAS